MRNDLDVTVRLDGQTGQIGELLRRQLRYGDLDPLRLALSGLPPAELFASRRPHCRSALPPGLMPNPHQLTVVETLWALLLLGLFAFDLQRIARSRDPLAWFQPHLFLMAFLAYYLVGGPLGNRPITQVARGCD